MKTCGRMYTLFQRYVGQCANGACAHYVMLSKLLGWLATQLDPQNDWTGWHIRVHYDVCAQGPLEKQADALTNQSATHASQWLTKLK